MLSWLRRSSPQTVERRFIRMLRVIAMLRVVALLAAGLALGSCTSGGKMGDYMPQWMGGLPKDVPPRPGTPEYDEYQRQQEAERVRDKSKDPPKPSTPAPGIFGPQ